MQEEWLEIEHFPGYDVSNHGGVFSHARDRLLKRSYVQGGRPTVGLYFDGKQYRRSVAHLVAKTWLPKPPRKDYITPIHLDGNLDNCRADNLMWRPRWFAIEYHHEYKMNRYVNSTDTRKIEHIETGILYNSFREVAEALGVIEQDVHLHIIQGKHVFPDWPTFRFVQ